MEGQSVVLPALMLKHKHCYYRPITGDDLLITGFVKSTYRYDISTLKCLNKKPDLSCEATLSQKLDKPANQKSTLLVV